MLWMSIHLLEESDSNADLQRKSDYLRKALTHLRLGEEAFNESVRQVASYVWLTLVPAELRISTDKLAEQSNRFLLL